MEKLPNMVDMKKEPSLDDEGNAYPGQNLYPYGLAICLNDDDLQKLDLDDDIEVGEMVHLHCIAKITSVSSQDTNDGVKKRVELQITHIAAEDEDEENEQSEDVMSRLGKKLYSGE
jgi:hypothetical protein